MGFTDHSSLVDPKAVTVLVLSFIHNNQLLSSISRTFTHPVRVELRSNHRIHLLVFLDTSNIALVITFARIVLPDHFEM